MTVLISHTGNLLRTNGLARRDHAEIQLRLNAPHLIAEGEALLRHVASYVVESGASIRSSETMPYGYWLLKFVSNADGTLDVHEYDASATHFVEGADLALAYWHDQHEICGRLNAPFDPPRPDQMAAVSASVFRGAPVKGVRYPSPQHMSGWWLITDDYDGNVASLQTEHLYHVTALRPDLARYIALPFGYRFDLSTFEDVWFDHEVVDE